MAKNWASLSQYYSTLIDLESIKSNFGLTFGQYIFKPSMWQFSLRTIWTKHLITIINVRACLCVFLSIWILSMWCHFCRSYLIKTLTVNSYSKVKLNDLEEITFWFYKWFYEKNFPFVSQTQNTHTQTEWIVFSETNLTKLKMKPKRQTNTHQEMRSAGTERESGTLSETEFN